MSAFALTDLSPDRRSQLEALRKELARRQADWRRKDEDQRCPTGLVEVDRLLSGGFAKGEVTVLGGALGAGRTRLVARAMARVTAKGGLGAWIDPTGTLSAPALEEAGVDLARLLVVRAPLDQAAWAAQLVARSGAFALVAADLSLRVSSGAGHRLVEAARAGGAALVLLGDEALLPGAVKARLEVSMDRGGLRPAGEPRPPLRRVRLWVDKGRTGQTELVPRAPRPVPPCWSPPERPRQVDPNPPPTGRLPVEPLTKKLFTRPKARWRAPEDVDTTPVERHGR